MGLLNIIRRMHLRQKLSIREISRLTGVSRNTVTKHLAANTIEPKFATPERQSKIDPFADKLAGWLKTEAGRSRKERRTIRQLHAELVVLGFTGSYARVAAFARTWKAERQREQQTTGRGTFVPLHFVPGDAFQFDWSEDFAVLGGERTKLQMAHIKLSHSRAFLLRAYPLQTHDLSHWARTNGAQWLRCSMPIGMHSGSSVACLRGGFTTICARRWIVSAAARSGRSTCAFSP